MMEIDAGKVDETSTCRCAELEETTRKADVKIVELELEIGKRKNENEALEAKIKKLEDEKAAMECELSSLFRSYCEIKRQLDRKENKIKAEAAVDLIEDEDKLSCLTVENKTLEGEKKKAESDAEIWKGTVELLVSKLDDLAGPTNLDQWLNEFVKGSDEAEYLSAILAKLKCGTRVVNFDGAAANCNTPVTPYSSSARGFCLESKKKGDRQTGKHLSFDDEKIPNRVMASSTPAVAKTALDVINICDGDDEDEISDRKVSASVDQLIRKNRVSSASGKKVNSGNTIRESLSEQDHVEEADDGKDKIPHIATAKRKRAVNIVNSDTDSDDEDHVPLSKLKRMNIKESCSNLKRSADIQGVMTRSKRRLFTAFVSAKRSCSNQTSENKNQRGISTIDDAEDSESEEDESCSEEQSSSSFIDDRSDPGTYDSDDNASTENINEADSGTNESDDNASTEYEDEMDLNVELSEIVSKLRRSKGNEQKWIFQTDMLRAFAKDPEMCMKAVCALYRQQTEDEKAIKKALVSNNRGFSKFDANRGCRMAEFLIDGDPLGDLKKTVQELQKHDSNGVKLCRTLAKRYSKQLFEIYTQEEDPFFNHVELGLK